VVIDAGTGSGVLAMLLHAREPRAFMRLNEPASSISPVASFMTTASRMWWTSFTPT
jgi:hypothetical protein